MLDSRFTQQDQYFHAAALQEAIDAFDNVLRDFGYHQKNDYDAKIHPTQPNKSIQPTNLEKDSQNTHLFTLILMISLFISLFDKSSSSLMNVVDMKLFHYSSKPPHEQTPSLRCGTLSSIGCHHPSSSLTTSSLHPRSSYWSLTLHLDFVTATHWSSTLQLDFVTATHWSSTLRLSTTHCSSLLQVVFSSLEWSPATQN